MTAPDMTPRIGDRLGDGRFQLLAKLGEGGMSLVFFAQDHLRQRDVALKLLQPRYLGRPDREQRLLNEVEYLRRLQGQPRIVELVDAGRFDELGGWPWLATEVLEGRTLNWLFLEAKLEWEVVLTIIRQVAESLDACHRCGIVNRDVTPTNVMVVDPDTHAIKLFDFSHAGSVDAPRVAAGTPGRLTGEFDAPGTVGYMSPEQACKAPPDPTMDVFGFGALVYELVTHETPYAAVGDRDAFIQAQSQGGLEPLRLHAWAYDVPEELGELVQACTQRSAAQRPTMSEVLRRLEQLGGVAVAPEPSAAAWRSATAMRVGALIGVLLVVLVFIAWRQLSTPDVDAGASLDAAVAAEPAIPPDPDEIADIDASTSGAKDESTDGSDALSPIADLPPEPPTKQAKAPSKPKPRADDDGTKPNTTACDGVVAAATAAADGRDWDTVLRLTRRSECWPSKRERLHLEVSAHAALGRWADCVRVGRSSSDPKTQALVESCERSQ